MIGLQSEFDEERVAFTDRIMIVAGDTLNRPKCLDAWSILKLVDCGFDFSMIEGRCA